MVNICFCFLYLLASKYFFAYIHKNPRKGTIFFANMQIKLPYWVIKIFSVRKW